MNVLNKFVGGRQGQGWPLTPFFTYRDVGKGREQERKLCYVSQIPRVTLQAVPMIS